MEQKYELSDASSEDTKAFKEGMDELLAKLSLNLSLVINKKAMAIKLEDGTAETVFIDSPSLLIQKKTLLAEEGIVSPLSDEMTGNEEK